MASRRTFLKAGALGVAALTTSPVLARLSPLVRRTGHDLVFRPYPDERMPPVSFVYAADEHEDPFKSSIALQRDGIVVPEDFGDRKFSVNTRWFVEGFGYLWLSADNGGRFYSRHDVTGDGRFNLNFEFARSRVRRNAAVLARYEKDGATFSAEVKHLVALSEELLEEAGKRLGDGEACARTADHALRYALWAGETIELENARDVIARRKGPGGAQFGCETRQFVWAKSEEFTKRFVEPFDFATVTHYVWDTWYELFEPTERRYNWGIKDDIVSWLTDNGFTIEGRPLFWFHPSVTPDWLKAKSYEELKKYVEQHTHDLVTHYGDKVLQWEVVNEYHDRANLFNHTPEQITEIVRLACERTKDANPRVVRILNHCSPWAEYAAQGKMARMDATRPLRSPRKFLEDLAAAGVEYDVVGIQIYFPQRDLSDIARLLERMAVFGKPVYITEIGASSNLVAQSPSGAITGKADELYSWHRQWDEELQADWLEQVYTIYYSRPYIKAINWYDFSDFRPYMVNGGLVREDCSAKESFRRLKSLLASWNKLPKRT